MKMTPTELVDFIRDLELKYPVDRWAIDGIKVWPVIRKKIIENYYEQKIFQKSLKNKLNIKIHQMKNIIRILFLKNQFLSPDTKVLVLSDNSGRNFLMKGRRFNHNTDCFISEFINSNIKCYQFELFGLNVVKIPRYSQSSIFNCMYLRSIIRTKLECNFKKCDISLEGFDSFRIECVEKKLHINSFTKISLVYEICLIVNIARNIVDRLQSINLSLGLTNCWYNRSSMAFSLACRQLGIPCYDIQHGCAGASKHEMYYGWERIPENGYELMPTGFWCWDKEDAKAIQEWNRSSHEIDTIVGGKPIREWIKNNIDEIDISKDAKKLLKTLETRKKKILVTMQTGFLLPEWFLAFVEQHDEFLWIFREHPIIDVVQDNMIKRLQRYEQVKINGFKNNNIPLEVVLLNVDLHVTLDSSVIIDAMACGVKTISLSDSALRYQYVIESGFCSIAHDDIEFLQKLDLATCLKKEIRRDGYFEKGFNRLLNIVRGI